MNKWIADHKLTQQQTLQYIPPVISNLVNSNTQLSKFGIGPVSGTSLPFYAGRWIDPVTGRVRLLPTATTAFVNPLSRRQRLGFLQAKMINKWNNFV